MNKQGKLILLSGVFATGMIVANFASVKIASFGMFTIPAGTFMFAITFLCTDIIADVWGKQTAKAVVNMGFIGNLLSLAYMQLAMRFPHPDFWGMQSEYATVFGGQWRIVLAGLVTYLISQHIDVSIFHRLKSTTHGKHLWLRNNVSTMTSQAIDTVLFSILAFGGTMSVSALVGVIWTQYIFKLIVAVADTPLCYLGVKWAKGGVE